MSVEVWLVMVPCPDTGTAEAIARSVVQEGLAACTMELASGVSTYRWEGQLERASELVLWLKTEAGTVPSLMARIEAMHPYACPAVLAWPVPAVNERYAAWVAGEVRGRTAGGGGA